MTVNEFTVFDINKKIKFYQENIKNIIHQDGQKYMLNALFKNGEIPNYYYAGLDNRSLLNFTDKMSSIVGEPLMTTGNNYKRAKIDSWEEPSLLNNLYVIKSGYLKFYANSVAWGPVSNIYLATSSLGGTLISSAKLSAPLSLSVGDYITMIINLSLVN